MNSFNPTLDEKLIGLLIYLLFKNHEGLDAFYIADYFGMNRFEDEGLDQEALDLDEPIKNWLRLLKLRDRVRLHWCYELEWKSLNFLNSL